MCVVILSSMKEYTKELAKKYTQGRDNYNDTDERLKECAKELGVDGKDVLDLGCGDGRYAAWFQEMGARSVKGIDISPAMIELAQEKRDGIEFVLGDCENLPYKDGSFDLIFSNFVLHYCEDIKRAFSEIARTLKAGGHFVGIFNTVVTDNREILGKNMPVLLGYDDPVTVHNLMRLDEEYEEAIKGVSLEIVKYIDEPNRYAHIDPEFEYFKDVKELKNMAFVLSKAG